LVCSRVRVGCRESCRVVNQTWLDGSYSGTSSDRGLCSVGGPMPLNRRVCQSVIDACGLCRLLPMVHPYRAGIAVTESTAEFPTAPNSGSPSIASHQADPAGKRASSALPRMDNHAANAGGYANEDAVRCHAHSGDIGDIGRCHPATVESRPDYSSVKLKTRTTGQGATHDALRIYCFRLHTGQSTRHL